MNGMKAAYQQRFEQVIRYIDEHLSEDLDLERLSRVANFSKFHFHRQFSLYAGISASRYIQLMRLRRASYRLAFEDSVAIIDIALDAGFENPESFSRSFKNTFGQTPTQFRRVPAWQPWTEQYRFPQPSRRQPMDVSIVEYPEIRVAVLEHRGAPALVNESAKRFIEWRKASGLSPVETSQMFGLAYDDPHNTAAEAFRFDICSSVAAPVPDNPFGVGSRVLPARRCAVVRHHGSHDRLAEPAYYLYRDWLPDSGEELLDFPLFFHYHNLLPMTPEHELVTDVCLPLMPR
ncbi:AraC family transcriptional regulator [Marinobacter xestospongiae]|uniref:AraC family transcriptional regulator n=1 Tax=Marinobacter xestospongiae TaxID=994319 RepID=A0ABU3W0L5_9GAMM|nr:AraC family transcriptional regulator [Marinobacter xestospongiae]MDV2079536.1 AraC family transcriptional regulator [Marinobacter xestospongiae]